MPDSIFELAARVTVDATDFVAGMQEVKASAEEAGGSGTTGLAGLAGQAMEVASGIGVVLGGLEGAAGLISSLNDLGVQSLRATDGLNALSSGQADQYIQAASAATQGLVGNMDLAQAAMLGLSTGTVTTAQGFADMAKDGQVLGEAFQGSATQGIQSLNQALEMVGQTRSLKTLGLDAEEVTTQFKALEAQGLDKNSAWEEAVMNVADAMTTKLAPSIDSGPGSALDRLSTQFDNLKEKVGEGIAVAIEGTIDVATHIIQDVGAPPPTAAQQAASQMGVTPGNVNVVGGAMLVNVNNWSDVANSGLPGISGNAPGSTPYDVAVKNAQAQAAANPFGSDNPSVLAAQLEVQQQQIQTAEAAFIQANINAADQAIATLKAEAQNKISTLGGTSTPGEEPALGPVVGRYNPAGVSVGEQTANNAKVQGFIDAINNASTVVQDTFTRTLGQAAGELGLAFDKAGKAVGGTDLAFAQSKVAGAGSPEYQRLQQLAQQQQASEALAASYAESTQKVFAGTDAYTAAANSANEMSIAIKNAAGAANNFSSVAQAFGISASSGFTSQMTSALTGGEATARTEREAGDKAAGMSAKAIADDLAKFDAAVKQSNDAYMLATGQATTQSLALRDAQNQLSDELGKGKITVAAYEVAMLDLSNSTAKGATTAADFAGALADAQSITMTGKTLAQQQADYQAQQPTLAKAPTMVDKAVWVDEDGKMIREIIKVPAATTVTNAPISTVSPTNAQTSEHSHATPLGDIMPGPPDPNLLAPYQQKIQDIATNITQIGSNWDILAGNVKSKLPDWIGAEGFGGVSAAAAKIPGNINDIYKSIQDISGMLLIQIGFTQSQASSGGNSGPNAGVGGGGHNSSPQAVVGGGASAQSAPTIHINGAINITTSAPATTAFLDALDNVAHQQGMTIKSPR